MSKTIVSCLFSIVLATPAMADEFKPVMMEYFQSEVSSWANSSVLVEAITAQNSRTMVYDQGRIDALDLAWRDEVGSSQAPTIDPVVNNAAADFLRDRVAESGGSITEAFIMDARGLNVAASDVTSDYWQGDEAKFRETYDAGADGLHISDVELDESTQRYQGQISVTLLDPATGQAIGAMTIGVDVESIM